MTYIYQLRILSLRLYGSIFPHIITIVGLILLQHVFAIKPFDHAPQCMVSVPKPGAIHEEVILFGDDQGYLNILTVAAKDLTMKNSKGGEKKPVKDQNILHVIEPNRLTV